MADDNIQLEEFRLLKEELASRERAMGTLLTFGLVSSVSLLAALLSVAIRDFPAGAGEWPFAFALLAPLFILVPLTWLLLSHRREIHKIGSYLQAFYDERSFGTRWEVRIEAFRKHFERSHTLDAIPALVWAVFTLCGIAFGYECHRLNGPLYATLFLLIPAIALGWFHADWRACAAKDREDFLRVWRLIREAEA